MPKLDIFSANALGPLLLPAFSGGQVQFTSKSANSSKNDVNFANGQTDRILVPYSSA
jgi:hypothetical protein